MKRMLFLTIAVLILAPTTAAADHISIPATWDFESPVNSYAWSSTTRTEYFYLAGGLPPTLSSNLLGLQTTTPLSLSMMDFFNFATPYSFSFDLIFLGFGAPTGFSVVSHGQTIIPAGDFSAAQSIGTLVTGGFVVHFESLISPGATPMGGPGSCCGDVMIEWSMTDGDQWGIDNLVIDVVPEPNSPVPSLGSVSIAFLLTLLGATAYWRLRGAGSVA